MKYKYVLWDWNGTLLDDLKPSIDAVNDMLEIYGKQPITLEQYYSYVDTPIYKFYEHIFDLKVVTMDVIKPLYGELYIKHENDAILAEGAEKLLKKCKENGAKQYILSAAHIDDVMKYATQFGIVSLFEKIEAAGDYEAGSKIDRAKLLISNEKIDTKTCVMIGDTLHDYDTAKALGVDCVLYSKGHTDKEKLSSVGVPVCSSFEQIEKMI